MRILDFADGFESEVQPSISGVSASSISVTPAGDIASTNVQAALEELDVEKVKKVSSTDNAVTRFDGTSGQVQNSGVTIDDANNVIIPGNLTVNGTMTTVNSDDLQVKDKNILVNKDGNDASADGAGLEVKRTTTNGSLQFDNTKASKWKAGLVGSEKELIDDSSSQVMTNKDYDGGTASNSRRMTIPKNTKTNLLALTRKEGTVVYAMDEAKFYYDDGTNLIEVGSGSGTGKKNFIKNGTFENDTTGVSTYDDNVGDYVDGTGSAASAIFVARNTTTPLAGKGDLRIDKSASSAAGEGVSILSETIDKSKRGKNLFVIFEYDLSHANYVSGDLALKAYDVTNSQILTGITYLSGFTATGGLLKTTGRAVACISSSTTTAQIRFSLHITTDNASASAWTAYIDEVELTPDTVVPGAIQNEWIPWTPTGTWLTNTTYTGFKKRIGDTGFYRVRVATSGAPTSAILRITMPAGEVIDTAKMTSTVSAVTSIDTLSGTVNDSGARIASGLHVSYVSSTEVQLNFLNATSDTSAITQAAPITWGSGDSVEVTFSVPIVNWPASASLSTTETMLQTTRFQVQASGTQSYTASAAAKVTNWGTPSISRGSISWASSRLTIAKRMTAFIDVAAQLYGTNSGSLVFIYKNGAEIARGQNSDTNIAETTVSAHTLVDLVPNDYIEVYTSCGSNTTISSNGGIITLIEIPDLSIFSSWGTLESFEDKQSSFVNWPITAGQYGDLFSRVLQPGEYRVYPFLNTLNNGAVTTSQLQIGISSNSGNTGTGLVVSENVAISSNIVQASGGYNALAGPVVKLVVTTPTTYYVKAWTSTSITNLQYTARVLWDKVK